MSSEKVYNHFIFFYKKEKVIAFWAITFSKKLNSVNIKHFLGIYSKCSGDQTAISSPGTATKSHSLSLPPQ